MVAIGLAGGIALCVPEGDGWTWTRFGVALAIGAVLLLRRLSPDLDRGLAISGLTLSAVDRRPLPQESLTEGARGHVQAPYAYGPFGRLVVGALVIWHITAVTVWLLPEKDSLHWRNDAKGVFRTWLLTTSTDQGWGMFAPNPPSHNVFMRAVVIDNDGEKWDMRTDVYARERRPIPWIWNDRMRKMNRRIIGGEGGGTEWYQEWYARYLCRTWTLAHHGVPPKRVELFKLSYRIPSPAEVARKGWYTPDELLEKYGNEHRERTETCRDTIHGQVPNYIRERHDLPLIEEDAFKHWKLNRTDKWAKRHQKPVIGPAIVKVKQTLAKARTEARKAKTKSGS